MPSPDEIFAYIVPVVIGLFVAMFIIKMMKEMFWDD